MHLPDLLPSRLPHFSADLRKCLYEAYVRLSDREHQRRMRTSWPATSRTWTEWPSLSKTSSEKAVQPTSTSQCLKTLVRIQDALTDLQRQTSDLDSIAVSHLRRLEAEVDLLSEYLSVVLPSNPDGAGTPIDSTPPRKHWSEPKESMDYSGAWVGPNGMTYPITRNQQPESRCGSSDKNEASNER